MRRNYLPLLFSGLLITAPLLAAKKAASVFLGPDGKLHYRTLPKGDHIADFSYAGYMAGGVALPHVPALATIQPTGADDTAPVQSALDKLAFDTTEAHPGALVLAPGIFHFSSALYLRASGLVLRGSGPGKDGTTLQLTGTPHLAVIATARKTSVIDPTKEAVETPVAIGGSTTLSDSYVPSGSTSITVQSTKDLHAGDTILIGRPITPAWLAFMGMDKLVRGGKPETWIKGVLSAERIIASVEGNILHLTVPLCAFPGGTNPYSHTVLDGPMNYNVDLSLFKVFPITEGIKLRVNMDAFNAFNIQGYNNPSATDGTEKMRASYNTPRQLQFTARLTF